MKRDSIAYLCLGSNMGDSITMLNLAKDAILQISDCKLLAQSQIYITEPQNIKKQNWFANQILKISLPSFWHPKYFLNELLVLENNLGRERTGTEKYGPRCIDIDLLLFNDIKLDDPDCTVPHPRMVQRAFVLVPLLEIDPHLLIFDHPIEQWLNNLDWHKEGNKIFQQDKV